MKKNEKSKQEVIAALKNLVRQAALSQLEAYTKAPPQTIGIRELSGDEDLTYDHWIAIIMVSGKALRMKFRIHFTSKDARLMSSVVMPRQDDDLDPPLSHDFMKEFCNLTAGAIKRRLLAVGTSSDELAIGLPIEVPAFDKINLKKEMGSQETLDCWALTMRGSEIICFASIEMLNWALLNEIKNTEPSSVLVSDEGDIQFL